jgi:hypothetical protein
MHHYLYQEMVFLFLNVCELKMLIFIGKLIKKQNPEESGS